MSKICQKCGKVNLDVYSACVKCGNPLSANLHDNNSNNINNNNSSNNIICPYCHTALDINSNFCSRCGSSLSANSDNNSNNGGSGQNALVTEKRCSVFNVLFPPRELKGWNMGAFMFTSLWGVFNRVYLTLISLAILILLIIFSEIEVLHPWGFIFWLAVKIYFGLYGNDYAYNGSRFKTAEDFLNCQKAWNEWGFYTVFLAIVAIVKSLVKYLFKH